MVEASRGESASLFPRRPQAWKWGNAEQRSGNCICTALCNNLMQPVKMAA